MANDSVPARWEERSTSKVLEASREQILKRSRRFVAAAYELLDKEGLEGLTIRAVLNKTGLSRRAFYERFADKDDLVLAVFEETIRLAAALYSEQVKALANPLDRLKLIVTYIVLAKGGADGKAAGNVDAKNKNKSSRRGAAMSREHLRLAQSHPDDLQAALTPLISLIAQQLADGMAVGVVRAGDPQRLATLVYNLVSTTVHTELLAHEAHRLDRARRTQLANDIWEFCRRAVVA